MITNIEGKIFIIRPERTTIDSVLLDRAIEVPIDREVVVLPNPFIFSGWRYTNLEQGHKYEQVYIGVPAFDTP